MSELVSPLQDVIKRMASTPVEGKAAKIRSRMENVSTELCCLIDLSGSMDEGIGDLSVTKYEHLLIALKDVMQSYPKLRVIGFGAQVIEIPKIEDLPRILRHWSGSDRPTGGTPLHRALRHAQQYRPWKTIIISDGMPDDERAALKEADTLTGSIDTIYCGPDAHPALEFLRKLSRDSGGVNVQWDGYKPLTQAIRGFLPASTP